jgi:peptide/nickel transport system ATP-binding protein
MRQLRGKRAGFILQDPKYSLNPVKSIGSQVAESWRTHKGGSRREALEAAVNLLEQVKIRDPARSQHPIRTRSRAAWASAS